MAEFNRSELHRHARATAFGLLTDLPYVNKTQRRRLTDLVQELSDEGHAVAVRITGLGPSTRKPKGILTSVEDLVSDSLEQSLAHVEHLASLLPRRATRSLVWSEVGDFLGQLMGNRYQSSTPIVYSPGTKSTIYPLEWMVNKLDHAPRDRIGVPLDPADTLRPFVVHEETHGQQDELTPLLEFQGFQTIYDEGMASLSGTIQEVRPEESELQQLVVPSMALNFIRRYTPEADIRRRVHTFLRGDRDNQIYIEGHGTWAERAYALERGDNPHLLEAIDHRLGVFVRENRKLDGFGLDMYAVGLKLQYDIHAAVTEDPELEVAYGGDASRFVNAAMRQGAIPTKQDRANIRPWVRKVHEGMNQTGR